MQFIILIIPLFVVSAFGLTLVGAMLVRNKGWITAWTIYALVFALAFLQAVPGQTDGINAANLVMLIIVPITAAAIIGYVVGLYRLRKRGPVPLSGGRLVFPLLYAAVVGQIAVWMLFHF